VDLPFLGKDAQAARLRRSQEIADEVYSFFEALAAVLPYHEAKKRGQVPQNAPVPQTPAPPDCLEELDLVERWGLPLSGTWLDQPADYMADIEAARRGRDRFQEEQQERTKGPSKLDAFAAVMAKAKPLVRR